MIQVNFLEETDELVYVVAAVGRVSEPLNPELYNRLYETLTPFEQHKAMVLAKEMKFGNAKN